MGVSGWSASVRPPTLELAKFDQLCEIRAVEAGTLDKKDNPLKNAPHTLAEVTASEWKHPYSREQAAFPAPWLKQHKFWPGVARIDNAYGDKHLVCACPSVESYR